MNIRILYRVPEDYPELWKRWTKRFRGRGSVKRAKALRIADKLIVAFFVLLYLLLALGCLNTNPAAIIGYGASTLTCFAAMSLLRRQLNEPRPYEVFDIKPFIPAKDLKSGRAFPSRHTFSAFLIATLAAVIFRTFWGLLPLALACVLGYIRVLEGVHFPRDVTAGAVLGVLAGALCTATLVVAVV